MYMVGERPYYIHFKAFLIRTWNPKGKLEIYTRDNGFYLVKFEKEIDCSAILNYHPWLMDGKFIIMKKQTR